MSEKKTYREFRRTLQAFSGIIILFFLMMFIGETFWGETPGKPMTAYEVLQLSISGVGLIGLGLAWKWDLTGGIISTAAFGLLAIINPVVLKFSILYIWPLVGLLFIVLWAMSRKRTVPKS